MVYIGIYTFNYKSFKRIWVSYFEKEHPTLLELCVYKTDIFDTICGLVRIQQPAGLNRPDAIVKQAGTGPFRLCSCLFLIR